MTYAKQTWVNGSGGATPISAARLAHMEDGIYDAAPAPVVLYDASPAWVHYCNQEVIRIVGSGGFYPVWGTFTATSANPILAIEMLARVYGGALVDTYLVIGVRVGNNPNTPIVKPHPTLGTPIAAAGVSQFQIIVLPAFGWEQPAASFHATVRFGSSHLGPGTAAALTPGTTYIWQLAQTIQAGATTITVGTTPMVPGLSPDNKTVWVPNFGSNTVTPVSLGARPAWIVNGGMKDVLGNPMSFYPVPGTPITVGTGPNQCVVSPNGTYVAVKNHTAKTVTIINAATKAIVSTSGALAVFASTQTLAWSSDSTVVWASLNNGTIVPITATTGAAGGAVTVAAGDQLSITSVGGTTGWILDLTTAQVFPLSAMTGATVTVGAAIALASVGNQLAMSPADGSLWVYRPANNSLTRVTTAGVQSTTVLTDAITLCTGMGIIPDGSAIWLVDYNTAIMGFDCAGLQQSYYTAGGPVVGAYGVVLSNIDDIIVTIYNGNGLRVWPGSYIDCDVVANGFPPNQGVSVIAQGVTVP